jgi:hypothetical protein
MIPFANTDFCNSLLGQRTLRIGGVTLPSECVTLNQPVLVPAAFSV